MSHFKVTRKRRTSPHSRDTPDIYLEQLSSESILWLVSILFSAGGSLARAELSSEKVEETHFQSHSDGPSQQPAIVQSIPYLSYVADEEEVEEEEEEEEEEEADPVPNPSAKFHARPVPLPVALFGSNVEKKQANNNQLFMTEFEVQPISIPGIYKTISLCCCVYVGTGWWGKKDCYCSKDTTEQEKEPFCQYFSM